MHACWHFQRLEHLAAVRRDAAKLAFVDFQGGGGGALPVRAWRVASAGPARRNSRLRVCAVLAAEVGGKEASIHLEWLA